MNGRAGPWGPFGCRLSRCAAGSSANGPTEAINGRLETLRGIALGFRNLDNYITRSLLHTGGFRQAIQTHL